MQRHTVLQLVWSLPQIVIHLNVYRHDSLSNAAAESGSTHERLSPLSPLPVEGDIFVPDGDSVDTATLVSCTEDKATVLFSTARGSTTQLSFAPSSSGSVDVKVDWSAEEGLSSLSSALMLDASHLGFDDLVEEQDVVAKKLSLAGRFNSQFENVINLMSSAGLMECYQYQLP